MQVETVISILRRVIDSEQGNLSPEAARAVLRFGFAGSDQNRLAELASRSCQGTLTPSEAEEYEGYIAAADLLSLWKSKARIALKQQTSTA